MAVTNLIPKGAAGGEGVFTVTAGTSAHIKVFGTSKASNVAQIYSVNSDASLSPLMTQFESGTGPVAAILSGKRLSIHVTAPGDYKVIKSQTDDAVGIDISE